MGIGDDESDIVHDGSDIGHVIVDAFQLQQDGAHARSQAWNLDRSGALDSLTERCAVRKTGIAGDALREKDGALDRSALKELLCAFMGVEHAELQIEYRLAGDRETEVSRL